MQTALAGAIFLLSILTPVYLLHKFGPTSWVWHLLAIVVAIAIGFAPPTPLLTVLVGTFVYGFAILSLLIWGIGGLVGFGRGNRKGLAAKA